MPDTLSREDIDGLRRLAFEADSPRLWFTPSEMRGVLTHIDALTAAVEEAIETEWYNGNMDEDAQDRVLAILRGEQ